MAEQVSSTLAEMSRENVEIVRNSIDAYLRGDFDASLAAYAEDAEIDARHFPEGRVYRGPDGLSDLMRTYIGTFDDYRLEVEDVIDAGERVLMLTRESGISKGARVPIEGRYGIVFTVEDGRITRWQGFVDLEDAYRAAGLPADEPSKSGSAGDRPASPG